MERHEINTTEKVRALYGSRIKTHKILDGKSLDVTIAAKHIAARRPDAEGIVVDQPASCCGDAFAIDHGDGGPVAVYWYDEFDKLDPNADDREQRMPGILI